MREIRNTRGWPTPQARSGWVVEGAKNLAKRSAAYAGFQCAVTKPGSFCKRDLMNALKQLTRDVRDLQRILIVDDHPVTRRGLVELINHEPDMRVCGEAANAAQALDAVRELQPGLVLLDITLPGQSGLALIKDIQSFAPDARILVVSMHEEDLYAERVLRSGGHGYIMKNEGGDRLLHAIRRVLSGETYVSEQVSSRILDTFAGRKRRAEAGSLSHLTDREFEIFRLIGQGLPASEIGARLHISPKTVDTHRLHIREKLRLPSLSALMRYAVQWAAVEQRL